MNPNLVSLLERVAAYLWRQLVIAHNDETEQLYLDVCNAINPET